ncbi:MAG: PBP1A family penicillin-binding protein [Armatimonadota bacterium]
MSQRQTNRRSTTTRRPKKSRIRGVVTALQVMILLGIGASVGVGLGLFINLSKMLPSVSDFEAPEGSVIFSSDGVTLARVFNEDRTNVELKDIPQYLKDATIAIEDARFYKHSGVDMRAIGRAIYRNIQAQRSAEGASTITQQLARNVYLTREKNITRKVQEAVLAVLIERNFDKDRILELYLNQIYYGSGAFGVEAASRVYFGKSVKDLTLSESALIAGLPKKPSASSPHENYESAIQRRNVVLNRMAELGYISDLQRDEAKAEEIKIIPKRTGRNTFKAQHFVDYVISQLRELYGDDVVYGGGLRVYTTLNYEMQEKAEKALKEGVLKASKQHNVGEGCLVAVEAGNGFIRAMVGSAKDSEFNRATQGYGRQPGSAFKLFVYVAALESGKKPSSIIIDEPVSYPGVGGKEWKPRNYDRKFRGAITLKRAVAQSVNIPAIKLTDEIGVEKVIKYARAMGITSELEPYLPIAIGGVKGVKPLEMANAYAVMADGGTYSSVVAIRKVTRIIEGKEEIIEDFIPQKKKVMTDRTFKGMDEMLRAVVEPGGTGTRAASIPGARGKTGTTSQNRDAWFCGYVPNKLAVVVWIGNDDYSPMKGAYGGTICAPIWVEFLKSAIPIYDKAHRVKTFNTTVVRDEPDLQIEKPKTKRKEPKPQQEENSDVVTVTVCSETGLLASKACPKKHREKFLRGTEPAVRCNLHTTTQETNSDSGNSDILSPQLEEPPVVKPTKPVDRTNKPDNETLAPVTDSGE